MSFLLLSLFDSHRDDLLGLICRRRLWLEWFFVHAPPCKILLLRSIKDQCLILFFSNNVLSQLQKTNQNKLNKNRQLV